VKTWSISTTVRNPERIPDFTEAVEAIAGRTWDKDTQVEFMYELIRRRLYRPMNLTDEQIDMVDDVERVMTSAEAQEIFESQHYEDPPMRGRTAMAPIRDMGLVDLKPSVRWTDLGKSLVERKITLQDALLNYNLKWEVPTPNHKTFSAADGFLIKPFVGTLALIKKVNELWQVEVRDEVGLSRDEFNIYAPTLIDYRYIGEFAERIVKGRLAAKNAIGAAGKLEAWNKSVDFHLNNLPHGDRGFTDKELNNLRDYGDNAIRYFRNTGFIEFRGAGRYVDISKTSKAQADLLIEQELYKPIGFSDAEEYLQTIGDVTSFIPPWASESRMLEVKEYLRGLLAEEGKDISTAISTAPVVANPIRGEDEEIIKLKETLLRTRLSKLKAKSREPQFVSELIEEYQNLMKKNYDGYLPKPVALEFNTFKAFLSLNDALEVKPNYPVGDDGEPISTAPGGGTDLICEYEQFLLSVEVTMSTGRSQWVMEGQPVQRHLRDLEDTTNKPAYSLFLAPKLHADTVDTFWIANVHGYQGKAQRIIPLEFESWQIFLEAVKPRIESGELKHAEILKLFEKALPKGDEMVNSITWKQRINSEEFLTSVAAA
jgi:hypothetical protein